MHLNRIQKGICALWQEGNRHGPDSRERCLGIYTALGQNPVYRCQRLIEEPIRASSNDEHVREPHKFKIEATRSGARTQKTYIQT